MSVRTRCTMFCTILIIASPGILTYWKGLIYAESVLTVMLVTMQVSICVNVLHMLQDKVNHVCASS